MRLRLIDLDIIPSKYLGGLILTKGLLGLVIDIKRPFSGPPIIHMKMYSYIVEQSVQFRRFCIIMVTQKSHFIQSF
jgi:hypothetical protein